MSATAFATHTQSATSTAAHAGAIRAGVALIASGLAFVILALDAPALLGWLYDLLASSGTDSTMTPAVRFGAVLFGALTAGWGVTILQLGRGRTVPSAIMAGTIVWFVLDSAGSLLVGYAGNVLLNVGFAAVITLLLRSGRR